MLFYQILPKVQTENKQLSADADGTRATMHHSKSTIALYTQLDVESSVINSLRPLSTVDRTCHDGCCRQVLSTPYRPLSLFISHSPMVGVPWPNFLSPEFGIKFQTEVPLFLEMP